MTLFRPHRYTKWIAALYSAETWGISQCRTDVVADKGW